MRGLRWKACGVARSSGRYLAQRPACLSRKVERPLSAETPAPVKATMRWAARRRSISAGGRSIAISLHPLRHLDAEQAERQFQRPQRHRAQRQARLEQRLVLFAQDVELVVVAAEGL